MAAASGSTESSKAASGEWLGGAWSKSETVAAPRNRYAPGTCCSTLEKSSEPDSGSGISWNRSGPNRSAAVEATNSYSRSSLTVTGYSPTHVASAVSPWAAAMPSQSLTALAVTLLAASGLKLRTVASKTASSPITLRLVPAWKEPTVINTGSKMSNWRVTMVCSARTISQATGMGSRPRWGAEPWEPAPITLTWRAAEAAISVPGRAANTRFGNQDAKKWRP